LNLNARFDLINKLKSKGITPSLDKSYTVESFVVAIAQSVGAAESSWVHVNCRKHLNKYYMESIDICLDINNKVIKCECPYNKSCKESLIWFQPYSKI
jgi:hypothetical protein